MKRPTWLFPPKPPRVFMHGVFLRRSFYGMGSKLANLFYRRLGRLSLTNEVAGKHRARPALPGEAVNDDGLLVLLGLQRELDELVNLVQRRRGEVVDGYVDVLKAELAHEGLFERLCRERHDCSYSLVPQELEILPQVIGLAHARDLVVYQPTEVVGHRTTTFHRFVPQRIQAISVKIASKSWPIVNRSNML